MHFPFDLRISIKLNWIWIFLINNIEDFFWENIYLIKRWSFIGLQVEKPDGNEWTAVVWKVLNAVCSQLITRFCLTSMALVECWPIIGFGNHVKPLPTPPSGDYTGQLYMPLRARHNLFVHLVQMKPVYPK